MTEPLPVIIPLINPNEPEAFLAGLHVKEGQWVSQGDLLCTLETTKSAAEVSAEGAGYVAGLHSETGQTLNAGDTLCYLAPTADWEPPVVSQPQSGASPILAGASIEPVIPAGMRLTQPALALVREHPVDLSQLPLDTLVTEKAVRALLETTHAFPHPVRTTEFSTAGSVFNPAAIVIYGGGGHGKSLIDLIRALHTFRIVGIIDDGLAALPDKPFILGLPVLGGAEALPELYRQGVRLAVNAVGGIGNLAIRIKVFQRLSEAGFTCPPVVHPSAVVEPSASLSPGVQVFPLAYIGSEARIGFGVIVNTGAIVSHDCQIEAYSNLSPGVILAGEVQVEAGVLVGMSTTVNLRARIGKGARIGNGATVKSDVPEGGIVRAGAVWPPS